MGAYLCVREYRLSARLQDLNNAEFIDSNLRPVSKPVTFGSAPSNHMAAAVQADFKKLQENAAEIVKSNPIRYRMNTLSYRPLYGGQGSPSASPTPGPRATYKRMPLVLAPPPMISPRVIYPSVSVSPRPEVEAEAEAEAEPEYDIVSRAALALLMLCVFCGFRFFFFVKPAPTYTNYINRDPRPVLPTIRRQTVAPGTAAGHGGWISDEDDVRIDTHVQGQQWQAHELQIMQDRQRDVQRIRHLQLQQQQQQQQRQQNEQARLAYYYTHRND
jgi:hypothetical protein